METQKNRYFYNDEFFRLCNISFFQTLGLGGGYNNENMYSAIEYGLHYFFKLNIHDFLKNNKCWLVYKKDLFNIK